MKAKLLQHSSVLCVSNVARENDKPTNVDATFYLNPEAIVRYEPDGATITPPSFYATFVKIDNNLADLLRRRKLNVANLDNDTFNLLHNNKIILASPHDQFAQYKVITVHTSNLPVHVMLEVTSDCNCRCRHCYHAEDMVSHYPTLEEILIRIDHLKKLGLSLFEITGGEAFLRKDLQEILKYLFQLQLHYYIVTNGAFLATMDEAIIPWLKKGLGIAVSLDGVGETHDQIRQKPGLYTLLIAGLERMYQAGVPLYLIASLNEQNIHDVDRLVEVAVRFNTTIRLGSTLSIGSAQENNLGLVNFRELLTKYRDHPRVKLGSSYRDKTKPIPQAVYYGCSIRRRISVNSHGFVYPCVMNRQDMLQSIENYTEQTLVDTLRYHTEQSLLKHTKCSICHFNQGLISPICGGFCRFSKAYLQKI